MTTSAPSVAATSVLALLDLTMARNGTFCADNCFLSSRPIFPVAPVIRMVKVLDSGIATSSIVPYSESYEVKFMLLREMVENYGQARLWLCS
jgi:hypothetical protein